MKMKLLALAAMLATGSAQAAIDTSTSGNGELFLVVNDATAGYSFIADLGIAMDSFDPNNLAQSFDLTSYSQWDAFYSAIGGSLDNSVYSVLAVDSTGVTAGADRMWVTTSTAVLSEDIAATKSNMLGGASNRADYVLTSMNNGYDVVASDMGTVANGSGYSAEGSTTYWEGNVGSSMQAKLPFSTYVPADEAANFGFIVTGGAQSTLTPVVYTQAAGQWQLSADSLSYVAAVPEPETYAMMLAGLGLMGFVARRRKAA